MSQPDRSLIRTLNTQQTHQTTHHTTGVNKLDEIKSCLDNLLKINTVLLLFFIDWKRKNDTLEQTVNEEKNKNRDLLIENAKMKAELEDIKKKLEEYEMKNKILEHEKTKLKYQIVSLKDMIASDKNQEGKDRTKETTDKNIS